MSVRVRVRVRVRVSVKVRVRVRDDDATSMGGFAAWIDFNQLQGSGVRVAVVLGVGFEVGICMVCDVDLFII